MPASTPPPAPSNPEFSEEERPTDVAYSKFHQGKAQLEACAAEVVQPLRERIEVMIADARQQRHLAKVGA